MAGQGLTEVPCWVREMSDEDAYMALVLNNAPGELTPLEVGLHAIGSGLTQRDYAAKIGMKQTTLVRRRQAPMAALFPALMRVDSINAARHCDTPPRCISAHARAGLPRAEGDCVGLFCTAGDR